jgi:hypothetical protein
MSRRGPGFRLHVAQTFLCEDFGLHKGFKAVREIGPGATIRPPKVGFEWMDAQTLDEQIAMAQAKTGAGGRIRRMATNPSTPITAMARAK